jgi:hypothetical protein
MTNEEGFITMTSKIRVLKLFSSSLTKRPHKLERLAYPSGGAPFYGKLLAFYANIRLG